MVFSWKAQGWEGHFIFGDQSVCHTIFGQSTNVRRTSQSWCAAIEHSWWYRQTQINNSHLSKKECVITTINQVLTFTSAASVEQVEDPIFQVS